MHAARSSLRLDFMIMVENRWGEFRMNIGVDLVFTSVSVVDEVVHCGLTSLEFRSMTFSTLSFLLSEFGQFPGGTLH